MKLIDRTYRSFIYVSSLSTSL